MTMHTGTTISDLERMVRQAEAIALVTELFRAHAHEFEVCRGCMNFVFECDCHPRDEREELYDDPARGV